MFVAFAGLIAGFLHVLSGPDHLAAVAPLATDGRRHAWRAGLRWGLGHSAGVAVVGILSLLLRGWLPLEAISGWSERFVGVLLIGIGLWALRRALQIHSHPHEHHGEAHEHIHMHGAREHSVPRAHVHTHAAFGIGTVHGLAGSSHFLGILPALALPTSAQAIVYLAAFAAGTVAAMIGFSCLIGSLAARFAMTTTRALRGLMAACACAAIAVGAAWLAL